MLKLRGRKIRDDGAIDDDLDVDFARVRGSKELHFKYFDALLMLYDDDPRDLVAHLCANKHEFTLPVLRAVATHIVSGGSAPKANSATNASKFNMIAPYATKTQACESLVRAVGKMTIRGRFERYLSGLLDIPKQIIWSNTIIKRWATILKPYFRKELCQYVALSDKVRLPIMYGLGRNPVDIHEDLIVWRDVCYRARDAIGKLTSGHRWSIFKVGKGANPPFSISNLATKDVGLAQILVTFLTILVQRQDEAISMILTHDLALRSAIRIKRDIEAENQKKGLVDRVKANYWPGSVSAHSAAIAALRNARSRSAWKPENSEKPEKPERVEKKRRVTKAST